MKAINYGFTDTPISGVTSLELPRGLVNYGADFRVKSNTKDELIMTNLTCPIDRPEKVRIAWSQKKDAYANTGIAPAYQAPNTTGVSLLVQETVVGSVTDSTDPTYRVDAPISAHIVINTIPLQEVSENDVLMVVGRLVSSLFETGSEANTRLKALLRGSLEPSDL